MASYALSSAILSFFFSVLETPQREDEDMEEFNRTVAALSTRFEYVEKEVFVRADYERVVILLNLPPLSYPSMPPVECPSPPCIVETKEQHC